MFLKRFETCAGVSGVSALVTSYSSSFFPLSGAVQSLHTSFHSGLTHVKLQRANQAAAATTGKSFLPQLEVAGRTLELQHVAACCCGKDSNYPERLVPLSSMTALLHAKVQGARKSKLLEILFHVT